MMSLEEKGFEPFKPHIFFEMHAEMLLLINILYFVQLT